MGKIKTITERIGEFGESELEGSLDDVIAFLQQQKDATKEHLYLLGFDPNKVEHNLSLEAYTETEYYGSTYTQFVLMLTRPETEEEKRLRLQQSRKMKAKRKKEKAEREAREKKEYERLKKKFEKSDGKV